MSKVVDDILQCPECGSSDIAFTLKPLCVVRERYPDAPLVRYASDGGFRCDNCLTWNRLSSERMAQIEDALAEKIEESLGNGPST